MTSDSSSRGSKSRLGWLKLLVVGLFAAVIGLIFQENSFSVTSPDTVNAQSASNNIIPVINYTGRLKDASDNPIPAAAIDLTFKIYDGPNALTATQLWTENYTGVTVKKGYFNVKLGSQVPFPASLDFSQQYYLGIAVNTDPEMTPLVPFTPLPYAFYAFRSDHANSADTASHAATAGHANTADLANFANQAGYATNSGHANTADQATNADYAANAGYATNSGYATESGHAATSSTSHWADYTDQAQHAVTADQAATSSTSHTADFALNIPGLSPLRLVGTDANGQIVTALLVDFLTTATPALLVSDDGQGGVILDLDLLQDVSFASVAAQVEINRVDILSLKNQMVLNAYDIATIAAQVLSNSQNISSNIYDIATLAAGLNQLPADIIQNKIDNATEAAAIYDLQQITNQFGLDISTMSAQILLNKLNIATNTAQITQSQNDIATIAGKLDSFALGTVDNSTMRWDSATNSWVENTNFLVDGQGNATLSGNLDIQQNLNVEGGATISGHLEGTSATFSASVQADQGIFNALQDSYGKTGLPGQVLSINQLGLLQWMYATASAGTNLNIADNGTLLPNQPILNIIGDSYTLTNDASNSAIILNIAELGKIGSYLADTSSIRDGQIMVFDAIQQKFVPMYLADSSTATSSCVKQVEISIGAADVGVAQNISVERNKTQTRAAVEILKKQPPITNNNILIHDFLLSESNQYNFNSNYMNLDGQLYPKTDYLANSIYQRNLDSEHNLYQTTITQSEYKQIRNLGLVASSPETLYDYVTRGLTDGSHNLVLSNGEVLPAEVYNFSNDVQYTSNPTLGDTSTNKTLVLIYHGDLIVNAGVTMQPQVGKRGMLIFVKGNLINNGTISMSARGVAAVGQEVLLYKNFDGSFEKVPALGAVGGARNLGNSGFVSTIGKTGAAGVNRQTGGGGSGGMAAKGGSGTRNSGAGAAGTSYSGGSGGGGAALTNWSGNMIGGDGGANGGAGGTGSPNWYCAAGGGAGNPGGDGTFYNLSGGVISKPIGGTGTGGLLIIYTGGDLTNNSSIQANGVAGATATNTLASNTGSGPNAAGGGGSGGGSINLFSQGTYTNVGTVAAAGGAGGGATANGAVPAAGGVAGAGSITASNLASNYYLFNDAGQIKTYDSGTGTFTVIPGGLTAAALTQTDFAAYGVINLYNIAPTDWLQLSSTFEILTSSYLASPIFSFKAIPQDQLVTDRYNFATGAIQQIINGSFTSNASQYADIKVVVSPDSDTTWYTSPDLVNWIALTDPLSASTVITNGIKVTDFNNIIDDLLNLPNILDTETIRFAYAFNLSNLGDTAALDNLSISYLTYDSWMRAFNNIDYNYSYSTPQVLSVTFNNPGEYKVNITDTACVNNLGGGNLNLPDGTNPGDVLTWDGTAWIAAPAATGSGALWTRGDNSHQIAAILPNVGIGTTDPQYALDVTGLARFGGLVDSLGLIGLPGQMLSIDAAGNLLWSTPSAQVDLSRLEYDIATMAGTLDHAVLHDDYGNATISGSLQVDQDASIAGTAYFGAIQDAYGNLGGPEQVLVFDETGKLKWVDARGFISAIPWQIQNNGTSLPHRPILNIIGDSYTLLDDATSSATILNISEKGKIGGYLADTTNIRDGQIMVFDSISQSFVPMFMGVTTATDSCNIQHEFNVTSTPVTESILVDRVKDQDRPAVEVLKKVPPVVNTDVTVRTFGVADRPAYTYDSNFQALDGRTYQKTTYQQYPTYVRNLGGMGVAADLDLYQASIDASQFKQVTSLQSALGTGSINQTGSLYGLIKGNYSDPTVTPNGNYNLTLQNGQVIPIQLVHFTSNMTYTSSPSLGDTTTDGPMLVLYYHGDLTVGSGVTLTPQVRRKGMTVIVDGTLTNHGNISMTARGAAAAGQELQLYRNAAGTYETVPAAGASGGIARNVAGIKQAGDAGSDGVNRRTGGGGSGSAGSYISPTGSRSISGSGAAGTSYSGGSGGGAAENGGYGGTAIAGSGTANGGAGGEGRVYRGCCANDTVIAGGGAGNNGGAGYYSNINAAATTTGTARNSNYGQNGTGGLLNIYAQNLINNGSITSHGSNGGNASEHNNFTGGGGASGGGSVNVFSASLNNTGLVAANGGTGGNNAYVNNRGGNGGDGSVTLTDISLNYYLFDDNGTVKYYDSGSGNFNVLPGSPTASTITGSDFITYGLADLSVLSPTVLTTLSSNFTVLIATSKTNPDITIQALPQPQLVVDKTSFDVSTIEQITGGILDYTQTGTGNLKLVVSIDNGNTWLTTLDTGVTWQQVGTGSALTAQTVINEGILASDFNNVFDDFLNIPNIRDNNQLRFAYAFDLDAISDVASLQDMKLSFVTFPGWARASHVNSAGTGGDYNYQYTTPQVLEVTFLTPNEYKVNLIGSDCNGLGSGGGGYNLPNGSTPGQVLTWDGSSWVPALPGPSATSAAQLWVNGNSLNQISSSLPYVGIGTTDPQYALHVNGLASFSGLVDAYGNTGNYGDKLTIDINGKLKWDIDKSCATIVQPVSAPHLYFPQMTSDNTPVPFTVRANSVYPAAWTQAWYAFDDDSNTTWHVNNSVPDSYPFTLQIGSSHYAFEVDKYSITSINTNVADSTTQAPNTWEFQGSNDGSNWDTLDSQSGITWTTTSQTQTFTLSSAVRYHYYRLYITANNGYVVNTVAIAEFKLEGTPESPFLNPLLTLKASDRYQVPADTVSDKNVKNVGDGSTITAGTTIPAGAEVLILADGTQIGLLADITANTGWVRRAEFCGVTTGPSTSIVDSTGSTGLDGQILTIAGGQLLWATPSASPTASASNHLAVTENGSLLGNIDILNLIGGSYTALYDATNSALTLGITEAGNIGSKTVDLTNLQDGSVMVYDAASGTFVPMLLATASQASPSDIVQHNHLITNPADPYATQRYLVDYDYSQHRFPPEVLKLEPASLTTYFARDYVQAESANFVANQDTVLDGSLHLNSDHTYSLTDQGALGSYRLFASGPVTNVGNVDAVTTTSNGILFAPTDPALAASSHTRSYNFDDLSGNVIRAQVGGTNGTLTAGAYSTVAGYKGNALRNNNNQNLRASVTGTIVPTGAKTIVARFKAASYQPNNSNTWNQLRFLLANDASGNNTQFNVPIAINPTTHACNRITSQNWVSSGTMPYSVSTSVNACDDQWHTYIFSYDGTMNTNSLMARLDDVVAYGTPVTAERTWNGTGTKFYFISGDTIVGDISIDQFDVYNAKVDFVHDLALVRNLADNQIYYFNTATQLWTALASSTPTQADFDTYGIRDWQTVPASSWSQLGSAIEFLVADVDANTTQKLLTATILPPPQVVIEKADVNLTMVDSLINLNFDYQRTGTGEIAWLVSDDFGQTYYTTADSGVTWSPVAPSATTSASQILSQGITTADLATTSNITSIGANYQNLPNWSANKNLRFLYALQESFAADVASVDKMTVVYNSYDPWTKAIYGTDYTYRYLSANILEVKYLTANQYKTNIVTKLAGTGGSVVNGLWVQGDHADQIAADLPKVGIGTTDPQYALDVRGIASVMGLIVNGDANISATLSAQNLIAQDSQLFKLRDSQGNYGQPGQILTTNASGQLVWADNTASTSNITVNGVAPDTDGNIQIGAHDVGAPTSSPIQIGVIVPALWTDDVVTQNGETWLKLNGQTVDATLYPALAALFPAQYNIITPAMTANNSGGVTVTSSSVYSSAYQPYLAFDQLGNSRGWAARQGNFNNSTGIGNDWLQIQLPGTPDSVHRYILRSYNSSETYGRPRDWTLQGSNDGSNWTVIDTQVGVTFPNVGYSPYEVELTTPANYSYYRLNITGVNSGNFVQVGQLELHHLANTFILPNYGQNAQDQYSYIKAADVNMGAGGVASSSAVISGLSTFRSRSNALTWNGTAWTAAANNSETATASSTDSFSPTLQFSDLDARISDLETNLGQLEQTLGFTEENSLDSIAAKVDLLNQLSLDSYQIASAPAVYASANKTSVLTLADVAELSSDGILTFNLPLNFSSEVTFSGQTVFNPDTAGTITIPAGTHSAYYAFSQSFKFKPIITLTPTQNTSVRHWLEQVSHDGFTVRINKVLGASDSALYFNWTAIQTNWNDQ